jgi:2-polyprenyl-3-methyl-5-hydroxy-6-metoxy-1,4-benzoquinol methylase
MVTAEQRMKIGDVLRETYFRGWKPEFLATDAFEQDLADHVHKRHEDCERYLIPWISRVFSLRGAEVIEIGCGTGSSTAALAPHVRHVLAYDISEPAVRAAERRFEVLGLSGRATFRCLPAASVLSAVEADARGRGGERGIDAILIYAVLEHQTVSERLETLRTCWRVLRPGGVLIVADTPNRLTYFDAHTSDLPFFHMLPDEIAIPYACRSPREGLRTSIADATRGGPSAAQETLARWGRGVSFHEFELALGDLGPLIVADGFAPEMQDWLGSSLEEEVLLLYWTRRPVPIPVAFARKTIDVILRKPG